MKTYSNKIDPPKKKKGATGSSVELTFSRGKETKDYQSARAHTGDKRYGNENPKNKDAKFIEDARAKKKDIAYDSEGKSYRAGYTKTTKEPDKVGINIKKPDLSGVKIVESKKIEPKKEVKKSGKSGGKLKARAMTYGTDDPKKGGGTKYKNKVKAIMRRG